MHCWTRNWHIIMLVVITGSHSIKHLQCLELSHWSECIRNLFTSCKKKTHSKFSLDMWIKDMDIHSALFIMTQNPLNYSYAIINPINIHKCFSLLKNNWFLTMKCMHTKIRWMLIWQYKLKDACLYIPPPLNDNFFSKIDL